ncbi:UPF0234 protein [Dirofilaria immitis]
MRQQKLLRNGTKWIYIEFFDCPSIVKISVNTIRTALARWINEECATAIQCNLDNEIKMENVLVGTIFCDTSINFITIIVLRNATDDISLQANHLDLNIVGKVIQSREHLLSILLHSDLKLVTIRMFNEEMKRNISITSDNRNLCSHLYCTIIVLSFILFVITFSIVYFIQRNFMKHKFITTSHSLLSLQPLRD